MANHAICLLTYVVEHPDEEQSYGILSKATGIPPSTIEELTHWKHDMAPTHGDPLFVWAENLGYEVRIFCKPGLILSVVRKNYDGL